MPTQPPSLILDILSPNRKKILISETRTYFMDSQSSPSGNATEPCPLCLSKQLKILFSLKAEQFVRCKNCLLTHINPKPESGIIRSTYLDNYSKSYEKKSEKKIKRARRYVRRMERQLKRKGRWLDVGCSAGFIVKASKDSGFESYGIDVDPEGIAYAKSFLSLSNVKIGTIENTSFETESFDVISAYDVIEHVEDIHSFTARLKELLAPEGIIDLITPNIEHWSVPKDLKIWKEIKPSEHLYYFSKKNLKQLLEEHGLQILKIRFTLKATLKVLITHTKN